MGERVTAAGNKYLQRALSHGQDGEKEKRVTFWRQTSRPIITLSVSSGAMRDE